MPLLQVICWYISDLCNAIVNVKWWPVTRPARSLRVRKPKNTRSFNLSCSWLNHKNRALHWKNKSKSEGMHSWNPTPRFVGSEVFHRSFPNGGFACATLWYFMTLYEDCDYQPWHFGVQSFCWYPPVMLPAIQANSCKPFFFKRKKKTIWKKQKKNAWKKNKNKVIGKKRPKKAIWKSKKKQKKTINK